MKLDGWAVWQALTLGLGTSCARLPVPVLPYGFRRRALVVLGVGGSNPLTHPTPPLRTVGRRAGERPRGPARAVAQETDGGPRSRLFLKVAIALLAIVVTLLAAGSCIQFLVDSRV